MYPEAKLRVRSAVLRALVAVSLAGVPVVAIAATTPPTPWAFSGADISDTHATYTASGPQQLAPSTVRGLKTKWAFQANGSISTTPTVEQGGLYVPDWAGYLDKIDPDTGGLIWQVKLSTFTGSASSMARTSPAISGNTIVVGDISRARVIALNKTTGALLWTRTLNSFAFGTVLGSPTVYNGVVYVGIATAEEGQKSASYTYVAQGSVAALNLATGAVIWQFTTVPHGYAGGGVWGSGPAVSPSLGLVFVGTGNNTVIPQAASTCVASAGTDQAAQLACLDPSDYVDAILALNMKTGAVVWSRRFQGADTWRGGCSLNPPTGCPTPTGLDADFASAPNLIALPAMKGKPDDRGGTGTGYLLGAGQKSGVYWGINPVNGGLFWSTPFPGGQILWGSAAGNMWSDYYIFTAVSNQKGGTRTLLGQAGANKPVSWSGGYWNAIQASTGKLIWQVPASASDLANHNTPAETPGPVSFTNKIAFAGDTGGNLVALDATTGYKFWTFPTGVTVKSAPAIFNDTLYWGVGYPWNIAGDMLYAFAVPH